MIYWSTGPIKERKPLLSGLPHGNVAAVNNNRPQFCLCLLLVAQLCRDSGPEGPAGRQQRVLQSGSPLISVRTAGRGAGPDPDQLPEHRVGVRAEPQLPQSGPDVLWGVTQLPEGVHPELELLAVWFQQTCSWALAGKYLIHDGASGPLFSCIEDVLYPPLDDVHRLTEEKWHLIRN